MSTPASPKVVVWRGEEPQKIRQNYCPASEVCIFNLSLLLPVRIYKLSVAILATGRADQAPPCDLPACLLVVRLPPLSVLRRLAQVPPLSVLRRLMEPLALLRGLLFVVGRPPLRLGAAPLVWVDWRHHPVLGPARRERSTRRGCWPACLRSWSSSVRSSNFLGVHSKSDASTFSRVTRWDSSGRTHKRRCYVMTCWPSSRCGVSPLSQAAAA